MRQDILARYCGMLAGAASIAIGAAVMILWLARPMGLAEAAPTLFAMQFNAALCFVLAGAAICLLLNGALPLSAGLSGLAGLLAAATLAEHLLHVDLGIDRMFVAPFVSPGTGPAGRMAPNTALCFLLLSASVALTALLGRSSSPLRVLLAALVFMISTTALIGYLLSVSTAREWLPLARMSPQSAFCFATLSTGLILGGIVRLGYDLSTVAATLGAATYLLLVLMTYVELIQRGEDGGLPAEGADARSTLLAILLLSGAVYACLIVYAFRNSERSRRMALQLAESQKRLEAIIQTAVDGFVTIDERGTILSANPACERIFGYQVEEILGRNVKLLMPAPYRDEHDRYLANYRQTGVARIIGAGREAEGQRKDGSTFPVELSVSRIDLGHQVLYGGILRDISERKRHERDILDANAELEEFSYRTSHDLRSPIASSLGLIAIAEDMVRREVPAAELQGVLARIETSFRKLDHLIQNIISLTRTKMMDEPESAIAVAGAVRETVERLRHMEGGGASTVHIDIPETMTLRKRASRFQIILDNLLSNAIKYHDPAEAVPEISVRAACDRGRFVLTVADNGLGIAAADEPKLFQMFKRFHPQRAEGSGLGLYILRKSVEQLGGTVAYRRREKGSLFTVTLPQEDRR